LINTDPQNYVGCPEKKHIILNNRIYNHRFYKLARISAIL
jgi:hypothetical protein